MTGAALFFEDRELFNVAGATDARVDYATAVFLNFSVFFSAGVFINLKTVSQV